MSGTFEVEWLPGGVLLQKRTGMFTIDQANAYVAAVKKAVESRPSRWGMVIDAREAVAQATEVQAIIQTLIQHVESKDVRKVAIVATSTVTGIQAKRVGTGPGMHAADTFTVYQDFDAAVSDVREALYR